MVERDLVASRCSPPQEPLPDPQGFPKCGFGVGVVERVGLALREVGLDPRLETLEARAGIRRLIQRRSWQKAGRPVVGRRVEWEELEGQAT